MSSSISDSRRYTKALFVTLLLGLFVSVTLMEIMLRVSVIPFDQSSDYKILFREGTAKTVAFGDSHVESSLISSSELDNLGQASDSLNTIVTKVKYRLKRKGVISVILQADPQIFSVYRLNADQSNRVESLLENKEPFLAVLRPQYRQYFMQFWRNAIFWPFTFFKFAKHSSEANAPPIFISKSLERRYSESLLRVQLHSPIANFTNSIAAKSYQELVETLKMQDIRVCLVSFPVTSSYKKASESIKTFQLVKDYYIYVAKRFDAVYLDYSDVISDENFGDPDHLLPSLKLSFTSRVLADCANGASYK